MEFTNKTTFKKRTRAFKRFGDGKLLQLVVGFYFGEGLEVPAGDECTMSYDHSDHVFIPVLFGKETRYVLKTELD